MGLLWLHYGYVVAPAMAAASCLWFLQLLESSFRLLACTLPTLGSANSANSMHSEIAGVTNRLSNIPPQ